eukprot:scaffold248415_cov66-Cyclotella_meneghiniana.AAC.2
MKPILLLFIPTVIAFNSSHSSPSSLLNSRSAIPDARSLVFSPMKGRPLYNNGLSTPSRSVFSPNLQLAAAISTDASTASSDPAPVQDALAGLTVAFSLLSKAIACSAIVGVNPLVGIWSSVAMGVTAPLLGAQAGVISGTAAVVTVPLAALTKSHGVEYMTPCILVSALMQGLFGILKLAKTAQLVSEQSKVFTSAAKVGTLKPTVSIAILCFAIVQGLPMITKAIPSSLVGLVVASIIGSILKLPLATLESTVEAGTFAGGFSSLPSLVNLGDLWSQ